ncbi:SpoIIE family protein phosphatase [Beggiatoa alba]|nr:SpoIIE family protein phosphatase [Beggiatoa alba]
MAITCIILMLIAAGIFYMQFKSRYDVTLGDIKASFESRLLTIDYVMQTATNQVQRMKIQAQNYLISHPSPPTDLTLLEALQEDKAQKTYNLDQLPTTYNIHMIGNLTGEGSLRNRTADFYRELAMALDLNSAYQGIETTIPNIAWVYYTSKNQFINIYPWVKSADFHFSAELYTHEFYTLGLPENNPSKSVFWTSAYIDEAGKGLMVTSAAPVYEKQTFLGTVALDFTLDILNNLLDHFAYVDTPLFIINKNQLLAHSQLVSSKDKTIKPIQSAFPDELQPQLAKILSNSTQDFFYHDGYWIIKQSFKNVPWQLVYWVSHQTILKEAFYSTSLGFLVLLPAIIIILMIALYLTRREFIHPANLLVQHIEAENQGKTTVIPKVPVAWQAWFETVSQAFRENRTLVKKLELYNASLEAMVAERTLEISKLNERLSAENMRMGTELETTRRLQQMILPKKQELKAIHGLDIASFMEPATEVGGDYYDVLEYDGHIKIGIGDITGHGLESGVLMLMVQTAVRTLLANQETDPLRFMNTLNRIVYDNVNRMNSDRNLSLLLLDYHPSLGTDTGHGTLHLSGQHEEIILVRANGKVERIDTQDLGFPLGLEANIESFVAQTGIELASGDGLVLYTDGIPEACNRQNEMYGVERLCTVVSRHWSKTVDEICQAVIADVRMHIDDYKVFDDITLLILKQQ